MNRIYFFPIVFLLVAQIAGADGFTLASPQIKPGGRIADEQVFNGFGCQGANLSPALQWKGAPADTKSFAVTLYDLDAPTGSGWWHWVVFNIPADTTTLAKNAGNPEAGLIPVGSVQSRTDFGKPGFGGPCPAAGDKPHRYQITLYALKTDKLPLDENAPAAMVGFYLHQNVIKRAVLNAQYSR